MRKRISVIGLFIWIIVVASVAGAQSDWLGDADLRFVDANGDTGYYVDVNSISIANPDECFSRVAIVRADENRLFLYSVQFNRKLESYQILSSVLLQYDTKDELRANMKPMSPIKYMKNSPMYNVVEFIYAYKPE